MYSAIYVRTSARSRIARILVNYSSAATNGDITNFRFIGASMSAKSAMYIFQPKGIVYTSARATRESLTPSQLSLILELSNRQVDGLDGKKDLCLICGEELTLSGLQGHLAAHMEEIALFVLPNINKEEEIGGSKASRGKAK